MTNNNSNSSSGGQAGWRWQAVYNSPPVEPAEECPGVHVEPPQPAGVEELLSGCFYEGVGTVSPGQVLADVNPEDPEAADSLHCSSIDGEGGVAFSLLLPVVHNQLLCFADVGWRLLSWHQDVRALTSSL